MDPLTRTPDPEETARMLQQVAERSAKILGEYAGKNVASSLSAAAGDELAESERADPDAVRAEAARAVPSTLYPPSSRETIRPPQWRRATSITVRVIRLKASSVTSKHPSRSSLRLSNPAEMMTKSGSNFSATGRSFRSQASSMFWSRAPQPRCTLMLRPAPSPSPVSAGSPVPG